MPRAKAVKAADERAEQMLVIYDKTDKKIVTGDKGASLATLTGLAAGTKVAVGDYKVTFTDGTNESDKVDVPAFEVPAGGEG